MKLRVSLLIAFVVVALAGASSAMAEEAYSPRTLRIARQLNCPVCVGESVADSQSQLARQMRGIIESKVQAGESDAQIKEYFRARYGDAVLAAPPKSGFVLTLWWMPVVAVGVGALALGLFLRERTRVPDVPERLPDHDDELERIAREVLGGADDGVAAGAAPR